MPPSIPEQRLGCSRSSIPRRRTWPSVRAPASREYPPADRPRLLGQLNGLYRGIFARESWTLSQSYYYGRVDAAPAHRVEIVEGEPIDLLDELDKIWLGPPTDNSSGARSAAAVAAGTEARDDAELVRRIVTGEGYHLELTALAARYIGRGIDPRDVAETMRGFMLAHPPETRDARWQDRIESIGAIVRSAAHKFVPGAQHRRAIARLTHRMIRRRRSALKLNRRSSRRPSGSVSRPNMRSGLGVPSSGTRSAGVRMRDDAPGGDVFAEYDANRPNDQPGTLAIWIDENAWVEAELPPRPWVAPGYALRGAVTIVAGPPSALKSSLMLAWAVRSPRIDQAGLCWLIAGNRLVDLSESAATIETWSGARQRYRRKPSEPGRVLAWELAR